MCLCVCAHVSLDPCASSSLDECKILSISCKHASSKLIRADAVRFFGHWICLNCATPGFWVLRLRWCRRAFVRRGSVQRTQEAPPPRLRDTTARAHSLCSRVYTKHFIHTYTKRSVVSHIIAGGAAHRAVCLYIVSNRPGL